MNDKLTETQVVAPVNAKYKAKIKRAYKHYRDYHQLVNDDASEAKQERKFNLFIDILDDLPKREELNFYKQHKLIHGYS
jgi:hypothetical protein